VADSKHVIDYYRLSADRRLLFGGGETYRMDYPEDIAAVVRPCMLKVFPQLADVKIDYAWGGKVAITMNRLPAFGRLSGDILYAQGFSGQGVALTTLAGQVMAEAVAGQAERFDVMAAIPTPRFPGGTLLRWPSLVVGMLYYSLKDRL
jgi:gamma-glutamylputrescine oxidase